MKKTKKRFLALLLTLTMVLSMGMQTFAVGTDSESDIQTQDIHSETETDTEDNVTDVPDSGEKQEQSSEEAAENPSDKILSDDAEVRIQSDDTEPAVRSNVSDKPSDGMTSGQPFAAGTGGSQNFRIPAMVTLADGTIVAAADARWNTTADAGGLDTIVSRSSDNGTTWNYTFANYLGDNGNSYVKESATFIDPALAADGSTVYMLVDLFPGGVALNSSNQKPEARAAFDDQGRLMLAQGDSNDYSYYLGEFNDGFAQIFSADGVAVEGYTADEYYNLYQNGEQVSNLFFSDAPYRVVKTTYLYLTKSTDKGATWSAPMLLNLKEADEQFYGVGPGTGIVTSDGTIMFSAYVWGGSDSSQRSSVIYSVNDGKTWERTKNATGNTWSSENQLVELNDGTIRMFFRNGDDQICYVDATGNADTGYNWGNVVQTGVSNNSNCQISALKYSQTINGKEAILLSCPTGGIFGSRNSGKIFVGLVNEDGSMDFNSFSSTAVTNGTFQYSCLTELSDGSVSLLYENGSASIQYTNFQIENLAKDAQIGDPDPGFVAEDGNLLTSLNFAATDGAKTLEFRGLSEGQSLDVATSDAKVATAAANGASVTVTPIGKGTATITATVQTNSRSVEDGSQYELTVTVSGVDEAYLGEITPNPGGTRYVLDQDGIDDGGEYLIVYDGHALQNTNGQTSTGYRDVTVSGNEVTSVTESDDDYLLWTFEGSNNQFSIRNTNAYVYLQDNGWRGADTLGTAPQTCTVSGSNGSYTIYGSNSYLVYDYVLFSGNNFHCSDDPATLSLYRKTTDDTTWSTDISKLQAQRDEAASLAADNYTEESWAVLQSALNEAADLASQEYASQEEAQAAQNGIDQAAQKIAEAIAALQKKPYTVEVPVVAGQSTTVTVEGTMTQKPDEDIATAVIDGNTMTITGVAEGTTTVVVGIVTYNITVKEVLDVDSTPVVAGDGQGVGKAVTKLTTSVGVEFDLNLKDEFQGQNVSWSTEDSSIASVDENGNVTGEGVGDTNIIVTIDGVEYKIPVTVLQGSGNSWNYKMMNIYISEITDSTVYYSENCGTKMVEVREGEAIYVRYASNADAAMDFFAKPNQGYALTRMSATNSDGAYFRLHTGDHQTIDTSSSGFLNGTITINGTTYSGAGVNQQNVFGVNAVRQMVYAAIAEGCDGGLGFTRGSGDSSSVNSDLTFRSEKLPEVQKEVAGILGTSGQAADYREYEEGMTAVEGETVYFRITVTKEAYEDSIDFTNPRLTEKLAGAYFTNASGQNLGTGQNLGNILDTRDSVTQTYYVGYKITQDDLDTTIKNTVDLNYTYQAEYSAGSFEASAEAEAVISAVTFEPDDIVIDFGSPVELDFSAEDAHGKYDLASGVAEYGDVKVTGNKVTYTPNRVLTEADTVTLTNTAGGTYQFNVYPASSVYYEEGFAAYGDSWTEGSAVTAAQTASMVNDQSTDLYGYDDLYKNTDGNSNNTVAASSANGAQATFTFNGTGLDIYALTTQTSGSMSMWLYKGEGTDGTLLKLGYVDTANNWLESNTGNYYNTPVFSYQDLEAGTYTVKILVNSGTISLDGFRVYGIQGGAYESVYAKDQEHAAQAVEIRDVTIAGSTYDMEDIEDWYTYGDQIIDAVYNATDGQQGAVMLQSGSGITASADMINNGPKNEIYLEQGQTIALKLKDGLTYSKVAVGLRSLNGGTVEYSVNESSASVSSTVDMYYQVTPNNGAIVITNNSANVLALTKIKVTGMASDISLASAFSMDADTMAYALRCIAGETEETQPAEAALTIQVSDPDENLLAETVLNASGIIGESYTFAAADIQAAAESILPEGYELTGKASNVEVAYGESETVELQAEEAAEEVPDDDADNNGGSFFDKIGNAVKDVVNTVVNAVTDFFGSLFRW